MNVLQAKDVVVDSKFVEWLAVEMKVVDIMVMAVVVPCFFAIVKVVVVLVDMVGVLLQLVLDVSFDNIPPNHCVPVISCLSLLANIHASFFIQSTKSLAIMRVEEKDVEMVSMTLVSFVKVVQLTLDVSFNNIPPNHCVPVISCLSLLANIHASFFIQSTKSLARMKVEEKDAKMVSMTVEDVLAVLVSIVKVVQLVLDVSFNNIPPNHCVTVISCLLLLANIHASFFIQSTKSLARMKVEEKDVEMVSMTVEDLLAVLVSFVKVVQLVLDVSFNNIPPNHCVPVISCLSLLANIHASFFIQ
jgi:hypothetical protein